MKNLHRYQNLFLMDEGKAIDHPDLSGQDDFAAKADEILERRRKRREEERDPKAQRAKRAVDFFAKSVIKKKGQNLGEARDEEYSMARRQLDTATDAIKKLKSKLKGEGELEAWVQAKLTKSADYLRAVSDYMNSHEADVNEETMTKSDIKREKELKDKYDDSEMKANFIRQYGEKKGKQYYFAYIRKMAMNEALDLEEAKISRTARRQANIEKDIKRTRGGPRYDKYGNKLKKGVNYFVDVDETLFSHGVKGKPNVMVHVKDSEGNRVNSLTNQQFNAYKLPKGHSYDFSEFRDAKKFTQTASPNKSVIKKIKKLQRRGKNVQLITARAKFDNPEVFRQHISRYGIKLKPGDIHYTGGMRGGDVGQKKLRIAKALARIHGTSSIHMYDDAAKVHNAFEAEKGKSPKLRIRTHLAKPNKRGEVVLRSYQATKEDFEFWIENLLTEGYDLSDFTINELYDAFYDILDEAAITAVGAPAPGDKPYKKTLKKLPSMAKSSRLFTSPYSRGAKSTEKDYKEEVELTPYEFWKSFIVEDQDDDEEYDMDENDLDEEIVLTPYDAWKLYFTEMNNQYVKGSEDDEEEDDEDEGNVRVKPGMSGSSNVPAAQRAAERVKRQRQRELAQKAYDVAQAIESQA